MSDDGSHRKRNLEGLLNFCVQNTASEDTTSQSTAATASIDPERKAWLEQAVAEFTGANETALMKKCLEILATSPGKLSTDPEEDLMSREYALVHLESVVDVIDNAKDCYTLGGFDMLLKYLDDSNTTLQWRALSVLGLCLQNNTFCQDQAMKLNILPRILAMVDAESPDSLVNIKALYALGCLIRGHEEAERQFVTMDGFSYLLRALQRNVPKLNVKTIFLISNLTEEKQEYLETLYNMGMVEQLIAMIQGAHDHHHEHVLSILLKIVRGYPLALNDCREEKYCLRNTLENRIRYLQETDPEAFEEEINYCDQLKNLCFPDDPENTQNSANR